MNYKSLQQEIVVALRGRRSQEQINRRLGYNFNQVYRWESGKTQLSWKDFLRLTEVCNIEIEALFRDCFSYSENLQVTKNLSRHFVGKNTHAFVAKSLGFSRSLVSRWLSGTTKPNFSQMLSLMDFGSAEFFRFIEGLTKSAPLPSVQEKMEMDHRALSLYSEYPWTSALLSAMGLSEYQKNPTDKFLSQKSKLSLSVVKATIQALAKEDIVRWNGKFWEAGLYRLSLRGSVEQRKKVARYIYERTLQAAEVGFGLPTQRFSWKLFSLNKNQYEKILQKYTEFFNELGTIIDDGQKEADKVYIFSVGLVDFDHLPEMKEK